MSPLIYLVLLSATGEQWGATFPPKEMATYLEAQDAKVLVAAAGEPAEPVRAAATAVESALRGSGRTSLVMNDAALGALQSASDLDVVNRAKPFPVQLVAIVRVFPGAADAPETAVVTFYDKEGKVVSALTATAGTPIAARSGASSGEAVSSEALKSVDTVRGSSPATNAEKEYDRKYVVIEDAAIVTRGGQVARLGLAFQGKSRLPIDGADFYRAIGRKDLAEQYQARNAQRWGLTIGGMVVGIAGIAIFTPGMVDNCVKKDAQTYACLESDYTLAILGGAAAAGGMVASLVGLLTEPHPVDLSTAKRLVEEHNEKLRKDLGLSRATVPPDDVQVALDFGVTPSGAGARLRVTF